MEDEIISLERAKSIIQEKTMFLLTEIEKMKGERVSEFEIVDRACDEKYEKSKVKYGESWKGMTPGELWERFEGELEEHNTAESIHDKKGEAVDMINCLRMYYQRLSESQENGGE